MVEASRLNCVDHGTHLPPEAQFSVLIRRWSCGRSSIDGRAGGWSRDVMRNGYELSGFWSRRIDREHRLVYRITKEDVEIIACRYHYGDRQRHPHRSSRRS
ncbi:Txe/YoeB family toxin of toxin-antitoxin system [Micromonospora sp. A202]|nr:Txe/YoeB family toxin of toxin-antitoxin system [Micromonospora sp. A202]